MSAKNDYSELAEDQKQELKKIALARIRVMPDNLNISIGGTSLNKNQVIKHIDQEDEIGEQLMLVELNFLQDLASGAIYGNG